MTNDTFGTDGFCDTLSGLCVGGFAYPGRRCAADAASLCPGLICCGPFGAKAYAAAMVVLVSMWLSVAAPCSAQIAVPVEAKAPLGGVASSRTPATTVERCKQALEVARLATEHDMHELSLRAVRGALAGGPPLQPLSIQTGRLPSSRSSSSAQDTQYQQIIEHVEQSLHALDELWQEKEFSPEAVYETLVQVVLPESRQAEVFLYPRPFVSEGSRTWSAEDFQPRSVGRLLVSWARRADKAEDLRQRILKRGEQPNAKLAAELLLAELAIADGDYKQAAVRLTSLQKLFQRNALQHTAELVCHVALPALENRETAKASLVLIEHAIENLVRASTGRSADVEPAGTLLLTVARARFDLDDAEAGNRHLQAYLKLHLSNNDRYGDGYGIHLRKQQLANVATEQVKASQLPDALKTLGEYADTDVPTRYGTVEVSGLVPRLFRQLMQLPAEERYRMLKDWSFPKPGRQSIRLLNGFVSEHGPPSAFAELKGESNSEDTLIPFPTWGPSPGVLSSAVLLADAAKASGQLDALSAEVDALANRKVENASVLRILLGVLQNASSSIRETARDFVAKSTKSLPAKDARSPHIRWPDYLVARACMANAALNELGCQFAQTLLNRAHSSYDRQSILYLRRDLAVGTLMPHGGSWDASLRDPGLALWQTAAHVNDAGASRRTYSSMPPAVWFQHEGHIRHVTGGADDFLYFAYPLTGSFDVSVQAFQARTGPSNLSYGGLVMETGSQTRCKIWTVGHHEEIGASPSSRRLDAFNSYRIEVRPEKVRHLVNGHVVFEDNQPSSVNPWLALHARHTSMHADRASCGVFHNVTITGQPVIPRQVELVSGDVLDGWIPSFYSETSPTRSRLPKPEDRSSRNPDDADPDWAVRDGVIHGRRIAENENSKTAQSRLYYHRPMRDGETLSYQFLFDTERHIVHPALDRLAFLIKPDGVRLHWMTEGDNEWTGLTPDNEITEPDNRRGPPSVPLKPGDWNDMTVTVREETVQLALNGVVIYERRLERANDRLFGFYHDKNREAAQVRNVVLRGEWPERLSPNQLANLIAPTDPERDRDLGRARIDVLGEHFVAREAYDVYRRGQSLPPAERYDYLSRWVLPDNSHRRVRLSGGFTPTHPAPPVEAQLVPNAAAAVPRARVELGGELVAPALLLIATAKELDRLDELYDAVEETPAGLKLLQRCRFAMLALIRMAQGQYDAADEHLRQIYPLLMTVRKEMTEHERWPEVVAAMEGVKHAPTLRISTVLLDHIELEQLEKQRISVSLTWSRHVRRLRTLAHQLRLPDSERPKLGADAALTNWTSVTHARASSRGEGHPLSNWVLTPGEVRHMPGHRHDYLYFNVPLRSSFEVTCDLQTPSTRQTHLAVAGTWLTVNSKNYSLRRHGRVTEQGTLDPPFQYLPHWYRYRAVIDDGTCTLHVNGRKVLRRSVPQDYDPWLAIHGQGGSHGGVRNVRIIGSPTIPDVIHLSNLPDLTVWMSDYYDESSSGDNPDWRKEGDTIIGRKEEDLAGSRRQSLLQYHRPLLEDGQIEYRFHLKDGVNSVHPALDRLTFLLDPEGVRIHWMTDAQYDRTGLAHDNVFEEPANRRGAAKLPLIADDWNTLKLALTGDVVDLYLNGQHIYQRTLEPTNQRIFGLFHYAGESTARVRDVTYRGNWPRELPVIEKQQLAVSPAVQAQLDRDKLKHRFTYDFRGREFDPRLFSTKADETCFQSTPDGLRMTAVGESGKTVTVRLGARLGLKGDFEITLSFEQLQMQRPPKGQRTGVMLACAIDNEQQDSVTTYRRINDLGAHVVAAGWGAAMPDKKRKYGGLAVTNAAESGRLRLSRKGSKIFHLFAENDSEEFELIHESIVGREDVRTHTIIDVGNADGTTAVVWKELTIDAEAIIKAK